MLVKWKILCSFGILFWLTMCAIEYVFGNILNNGEFSKIQEIPYDEDDEIAEYSNWKQFTIWGMFSFTASFMVCVMMKFLKQQIHKYTQEHILVDDSQQINLNSSGIDVQFATAIPEKDKCNAIPNLKLLEAVKDFPVTTESSEITSILVEKRCSKLKEEMREMQMNTWKEYSSLNKKLDALSKEKADLARQLQQAQKENKQLKQQLDDIVSDRSLLIKRLECATKEIKLNTSAKQMTLDKLEDAVSCSSQMRIKIKHLTKEKEDLEAKCKRLEERNISLKAQLKISLESRLPGGPEITNCEAESELEQSEKDIEKVQNKLLVLEKSLEKMRSKPVNNAIVNEDNNIKVKPSGDTLLPTEKDCNESEIVHEKCHNVETLPSSRRSGDGLEFEENMMDLSREGTSESGDRNTEISPTTDDGDYQFDIKINSFNDHEVSKSTARTISTPTSNMSASSSRTDDSVISIEDSESDILYPPGIVSQSPAFQKFLLKVLESPVV